MASCKEINSYSVGVLVVSDTVSAGEKEDCSGISIVKHLRNEKYFRVNAIEQNCVPDDISSIRNNLKQWSDVKYIDLILTVGGTGFSSRDVTPEATKEVIHREAPHLASRMIQGCYEKSKFSVLSRSVCGMRNNSLILNLPGSVKGAVECFEMIADLLPHAMDQLKGKIETVSVLHKKIQET